MPLASTEPAAGAPADGAPADAGLSDTTVATLRRLLQARREGWIPEWRCAAAAGLVADDARRRGLAAAAMLVALKGQWAALPEARALPPLEARALLDRLVTLGIRRSTPRKRPRGGWGVDRAA